MKFILIALMTLSSANAANILSAKIDSSKEFILVDVFYWGGCKPTKFHLKDINCTVDKPIDCQAYLMKETVGIDTCEGPVKETAVISIEQYNLMDYEGASFTIYGLKDPIGDNKAIVTLPSRPVEWY